MNGKLRVCRKCLPGQKNEEAFYEDLSRYIQRMDEELKVDQQRNGIHNGGDEGAGHDGRIKAQTLGGHGQNTAYGFGQEHGNGHSQANY